MAVEGVNPTIAHSRHRLVPVSVPYIFTIQHLQENLPKSLAEGFHIRKCTAAGGVNPIKAHSENRLIQFK